MTFVMIPAAILVYRDDTGKSVAEKLAAKARLFPTKPVLGTFLVMFAIINVAYFAYGGLVRGDQGERCWRRRWRARGRIRRRKCMTRKGITRRRARRVRISVGKWSTWQSGMPNGRPDVEPPPPGEGRCAPGNAEWLSPAPSSSRVHREASASRRPCACIARAGAWSRPCAHPTAAMPLLREATGARRRRRPADRCPARPAGPRVDRCGRQGDRGGASVLRTHWCTTRGSPPRAWSRRPTWSCGRTCSAPT